MSKSKADLDEKQLQLDRERLQLDQQCLELDRWRFEAEMSLGQSELLRAQTDRINSLIWIVQYLNERQDGEETVYEEAHQTQRTIVTARSLNPHEEDLLNACLIQLKRLVGFIPAK